MLKLTAETVVVASTRQLSSRVAGRTVIAGLIEGNYYALSDVGLRVWELMQAPTNAAAMRAILAEEFDVSAERCESDVMELLQEMAEEGLIEVRHAAGS